MFTSRFANISQDDEEYGCCVNVALCRYLIRNEFPPPREMYVINGS